MFSLFFLFTLNFLITFDNVLSTNNPVLYISYGSFFFVDFVSKSVDATEDTEEDDDISNPAEKLKTAVHSFLQKSANLVKKEFCFYCY